MSLLTFYVLITLLFVGRKVTLQSKGIFSPTASALSFQTFSNCLFMGIKFKQIGSCFTKIGVRGGAVD
jgi:hypothetical protein